MADNIRSKQAGIPTNTPSELRQSTPTSVPNKTTPQKTSVTPNDAARVASQAGFERGGMQPLKQKAFNAGDYSQQSIQLDPSDLGSGEAWSLENLGKANSSILLHTSAFSALAAACRQRLQRRKNPAAQQEGNEEAPLVTDESFGGAIIGSQFLPTEEGVADLQNLAAQISQPEVKTPSLAGMSSDLKLATGVQLPENTAVALKAMSASLVVAGYAEAVQNSDGQLNEEALALGVKQAFEGVKNAMGEGLQMLRGIELNLKMPRTFVKR